MTRQPNQEHRPHDLLGTVLILAAAVLTLRLMGRVWWCQAGGWNLWSGQVHSLHNSQHLLDPYTFTHLLHGIGLYALLWVLLGHWVSPIRRGVFALGLEALWEVLENTSLVIDRYREATISLGYYGDSIANSLGDLFACAAGYLLAMSVPLWASVFGFLLTEMVLLIWIRDGLLLNILMLIHPVDAIRTWQAGA